MSELTTQLLKQLETQLNERQSERVREVDLELRASTGNWEWSIPASGDPSALDDLLVDALSNLKLSSIEQQINELRLINAARDRLRDGIFGICGNCRKPVGLARLLAVPYTECCVDCQWQGKAPNHPPARTSP